MIKKHLKSLVTIAMLLSVIFLFAPTTAQARSFGGGRSFHTTPHITAPRAGGGHSFHTTPRVKSPSAGGGKSYHAPKAKSPSTSGGKSYHATPKAKSPSTSEGKSFHATPKAKSPSTDSPSTSGGKSYHAPKANKGRIYKSPRVAAPSTDPNHPSKAPGLFSGFGRAIVHGAGWSIGSNMGNSLWHTMFGFGGNQYIGTNGQTHYQSGGQSGWIIIIIIAVIAFIIFRIYRNRRK